MAAYTIKRDFGYDADHKIFKCTFAHPSGKDVVCTSQISFKDAFFKMMEAMGIQHKTISQEDLRNAPIDGTYTGDVHMSESHTCAAGTTGTAWPAH